MRKLFCVMIAGMFISIQPLVACTTFFLEKNGQMVFGKNYDWVTGTGMVHTNLKNLSKSSLPLEGGNTLKWTSKFGSVTFNQYGKEFPNGGMNEKGLVVELMWLSESEYPVKDNRPGLSVLQWIQYQLDNCTSVKEVIATDKILRITSTGTPQHYLVADSKGGVATIEFLDGKMVVHEGSQLPYPVLANDTYNASLQTYNNKQSDEHLQGRFSNACEMVQQYKKAETHRPIVNYSFDILNKVAQPGFTKWSIVYDISNKKVYFKSSAASQQKSFSIADFNYDCSAHPLQYNINQPEKGSINDKFIVFSGEVNKKMLKQAFKETRGISIDEKLQNSLGIFAEAVHCK